MTESGLPMFSSRNCIASGLTFRNLIHFEFFWVCVCMVLESVSSYFCAVDKLTLKFIWRGKRPRIVNSILKEKRKVGGLTLPNLKTYYKAIIRQCGYWEKHRQIDQWNTIDSPDADPRKYSQWSLTTYLRKCNGENVVFLVKKKKGNWNNWPFTCQKKKKKLDANFTKIKTRNGS